MRTVFSVFSTSTVTSRVPRLVKVYFSMKSGLSVEGKMVRVSATVPMVLSTVTMPRWWTRTTVSRAGRPPMNTRGVASSANV